VLWGQPITRASVSAEFRGTQSKCHCE